MRSKKRTAAKHAECFAAVCPVFIVAVVADGLASPNAHSVCPPWIVGILFSRFRIPHPEPQNQAYSEAYGHYAEIRTLRGHPLDEFACTGVLLMPVIPPGFPASTATSFRLPDPDDVSG